MIKKKLFFEGYKSILRTDSPAIALGCCFIAIGALLKNIGFNIQESILSTMLIYALPGSLVMAESILIGTSLLSIFIALIVISLILPIGVATKYRPFSTSIFLEKILDTISLHIFLNYFFYIYSIIITCFHLLKFILF